MMFSLYVQQNQWIVVALLVGMVLTMLMCLTYWDMWRPRRMESKRAQPMPITGILSFLRWIPTFAPWVLILVVAGTTLYTIAQLYMATTAPPNW